MNDRPTAFAADALEANRRGELTANQQRGFGALSRDRRKSALSSAAFLTAGAILIGVFAAPTAPIVSRFAITLIALAIAIFLVVRALFGTDALSRDLRAGEVKSVEGSIGKRRFGLSRQTTYFLDVGDQTFTVSHNTYQQAPDAGFVRVYFLPHSRKIVNLEHLPDRPVPRHVTMQGIAATLGVAMRSHSRRERNEARAELAGVGNAVKASLQPSTTPPAPDDLDPIPLEQAIVATWKSGLMSVTFSRDGRVTTEMLGGQQKGRWSVDENGRLRAELAGRNGTADARVVGNQLTITVDGMGMTFTRESVH